MYVYQAVVKLRSCDEGGTVGYQDAAKVKEAILALVMSLSCE